MKKLILLGIALLLGLTLTSCGEPEEEIDTVSMTVWASELDQTLMQDMIDDFIEFYSDETTAFEITLGAVSESNAKDEVLNDVEAAADVFVFADDQLNELINAGALQQVFENTDEIIAANGGPNSGSIAAATRNTKLFAYPMTADNGYFLFYDKSIYTETDVETLDGILDKAESDGSQFAFQINNGWYLYSFFAGAGLDVVYNGLSNSVEWNNATGLQVAEAIITMANHPGFVNLTDAEFVTGVTDGSITAGVNGIWNAQVAEEAWGENYAAAKLPTFTLDGAQVQLSSFAGYKLVGVNATTYEPYWAMKLAEWFTNEDNQLLRFQERGLGPSNINAAQDSSVLANPAIAALAQQSAFATVQNLGGNYWAPTETFGQLIVTGELTLDGDIQSALDTMVTGIEASQLD